MPSFAGERVLEPQHDELAADGHRRDRLARLARIVADGVPVRARAHLADHLQELDEPPFHAIGREHVLVVIGPVFQRAGCGGLNPDHGAAG